jgi:MarR family transcriptional regulator, organic hydroperoxide resistance regulator
VIRLTAQARALKEQAAGIPACILGATGCDVQEVVRLVGEIKTLRDRLAGAT